MDFESVIGLEVHAQLKTRTKIFCSCSTTFGAAPNTHTCPVCLGMPGVLPVLNKKVVDYTIRMALATGCTIAATSRFARKNYFYPDLPKNYQISQYELPIALNGHVNVGERKIHLTRAHMEEDAGKLIHDEREPVSYVDLNRTGVALMEIVSRPDIRGPEEAAAYVGKLRQIMRYLGTCDGNMQNGNLRADVNVSICLPGAYEKYQETQDFSHLGTRCEIKNMNSMRFIQQAIEFEARRQIQILDATAPLRVTILSARLARPQRLPGWSCRRVSRSPKGRQPRSSATPR